MPIDLIPRADWGARAPRGDYSRLSSTRGVKIHYTGGRVDPAIVDDHRRCAAAVRGIQNGHMDGNGWMDIGYTACVCPHRCVFVGRGPGRVPAANGSGLNSGHYAVLGLVGNSGLIIPPNDMLLGILDAIDWLREKGGAGDQIKGHRDGYATSCPGEPLYAWIRRGCPRPGETAAPTPTSSWTESTVNDLPLLEPGATGRHVKTAFYLLKARGYAKELDPKVIDPTVYSPKFVDEVKKLQEDKGLDKDGRIGRKTWPKLLGL
ncbi:N-acetylmuramoyl-L-alanine amidase [Planobispora siamensis]|uniref:N-acetylmuramoyl-L-alanine amidase n=1 Tax=Planobispora siamensis TaxID=936338 RepID=A0A8J3WIM1_9ACTN|nr:N-acetylmuramoyl-L-alanine amidase [Planobispora siamensis]GIH91924.1 N-acetylmuramoyl-L-alanine amidase [Planobispora siamensis]